MNTYDWLLDNLIIAEQATHIQKIGRIWTHIAGFRVCGQILAIYKDDKNYCAHADYEWLDDREPNLGFYSLNLEWPELIYNIALKYDSMLFTI